MEAEQRKFNDRMDSGEKASIGVVSQRKDTSHLQGHPLTLDPDVRSGEKWWSWAGIVELDPKVRALLPG